MINVVNREDGLVEITMVKEFESSPVILIESSDIVDWVNLSVSSATLMLREYRRVTGDEPIITPSSFWRSAE